MRRSHVDANGVSVHCEAVGDPADPAALLIMGGSAAPPLRDLRKRPDTRRNARSSSGASVSITRNPSSKTPA